MSPAQRERAIEALMASESQEEIDERLAMAEGDPHLDAKMDARDTLRAYFGKTGRRIYVGADIKVFYPGEKGFTPDVIAVTDVDSRSRDCWMVSQEGKGIDLALEVHYKGSWRKDFVDNVEKYAARGIREYFIHDIRHEQLRGYRLQGMDARAYEVLRPRAGRYRSEVLELDLAVENGRLRFYTGTAELVTQGELVGKLERMVETAQVRAEQQQARAEQAVSGVGSAILAILRVRGVAVGEEVEARIRECSDLAILDRWLQRAAVVVAVDELFLDS
jgi:Uma2 family endonuclease